MRDSRSIEQQNGEVQRPRCVYGPPSPHPLASQWIQKDGEGVYILSRSQQQWEELLATFAVCFDYF